jgi:hypothetical protein
MERSGEPRRDRAMTKTAMRSASWIAHAFLLALVVGYIGLSAVQSTPDANIGLGLGLIALGALGAPWTLPVLMSDEVALDSGLFLAVAAGGAAFNLALHAAALGRWRQRSGRGQ